MAALGIRLLSLATARRAVRRWFRRGWPLGDDSSDEEDDGQAVPPAPPNTPADTSLVSETDDDKDTKEPQPEEPEEPEDEDSEPYIDDSEYDQDFYNDSSTMSLNMFVPTVSGMQQAVAAQAVAGPANAQQIEEPQQLPDANPKEMEQPQPQPQQLSDAKVDALAAQMTQLNVVRIDEPVVAVTKPLSTPADDDATIAALTDPAVLAERAVHLKFIGEALDM
ncbi:hypothetical protein THAR02_11122, partial [Trichoderma harzianum]